MMGDLRQSSLGGKEEERKEKEQKEKKRKKERRKWKII